MATVDGIDELFRALDELPRKLQRNTLRRGLRKGAAMIRDEARGIVRRRSGRLAKQIRVASSRGNGQRGTVAYKVGVTRKGFYGRWLEYGHVIASSKLKGGGRRREAQRGQLRAVGRFVPPYPFMRPAAARLPDALRIVSEELRGAISTGELTR